MVREPGAVARPVELGCAFKVWPWLSAQSWHCPDADIAGFRAVFLANPKRDQRAIGREPKSADRWVDQFRDASACQVVELSRTGLRHPDVHRSVAVRQKRYELAVA